MRWLPWTLLALGILAPLAASQPLPGPACAPAGFERTPSEGGATVTDVEAVGENQNIRVTWSPSTGAAGYRIYLLDGGEVAYAKETASTTCARMESTNGRLYVVQVAPIFPDGSEGDRSVPVAAMPERSYDLAFLTLAVATVWLGVWGYAILLIRHQHRLIERYEKALEGASP